MTNEKNYIISTVGLQFAYQKQKVLNGIDLQVPEGSIFGFLGPNGAGKSTTIKVLLGLLQVPAGSVFMFNHELNSGKIGILRQIGAMVESPSLYEHLNAFKNLEITQRLRQLPEKRIHEVLEIVGLTKEAHRKVRQYSTGMKQRLSLAIAMLGNPKLLILDEPINGLDPSGIIEIRNLLIHLNKEHACTIFLSSHILDEIEKICSDVAVIDKGKVLYQGEMGGLLLRYGGQEKVLIESDDNEAIIPLLKPGTFQLKDSCISISVESKQETSLIVKKIVESGIGVYSVEPDRSDLERSFLEILREGGQS
ncbi:MAG: ABC transporter ATP-binding protein [Bacteroidales bacterium]|nr:ABC transporter ATP-binding protein [Bacteroidales bacterium]